MAARDGTRAGRRTGPLAGRMLDDLYAGIVEGDEILEAAIDEAIGRKPKGHDFVIERGRSGPAVARHMSVTGG